jgi:hypothetical protein
MRRVTDVHANERGGVSVLVALLMVVLLGFAALAIDVGKLYSERAQLQNGADALALMLAQQCAKNDVSECTATWPRVSPRAAIIVNGNALDGKSNIRSISIDTIHRRAEVVVEAKDNGSSSNVVSTFFARVLGIPSAEVSATSSVQWGTPTKGSMILPLAIAECKFKIDPVTGVGALQTLQMDKDPCVNKNIPGGFGWIQDGDAKCGVSATAGIGTDPGIWFQGDTGASAPFPCTGVDLAQMADQTVLFPLFDEATGNGSTGKYYVKGFAAFHVTGYHFSSDEWPQKSGIPNKGMRGYFMKFVSLSQALELGTSPDYGTAVVRLTIGAP